MPEEYERIIVVEGQPPKTDEPGPNDKEVIDNATLRNVCAGLLLANSTLVTIGVSVEDTSWLSVSSMWFAGAGSAVSLVGSIVYHVVARTREGYRAKLRTLARHRHFALFTSVLISVLSLVLLCIHVSLRIK